MRDSVPPRRVQAVAPCPTMLLRLRRAIEDVPAHTGRRRVRGSAADKTQFSTNVTGRGTFWYAKPPPPNPPP